MAVLVYAEHDNSSIKGATLNTVAAAQAIGGDVHVLVAGSNCQAAATAAAQIAGVSKVLVADNAAYTNQLAENVSLLVADLGKAYSHILAPATTNGKNFAPRVAALLDVAQISEITKVISADTFERPIYAGNAIATVQALDAIKVLTVRATGFDAVAATGGSAAIEAVGTATDAGTSKFVAEELAKSDRPELTALKSLSRVVVVWAMAITSKSFTTWLINWVLRLAHPVLLWMQALYQTTCKLVKQVKLLPHNCMLLLVSQVRFSIWQV